MSAVDAEAVSLLQEFDGQPVVKRSWFGTTESARVWLNTTDTAGLLLSCVVWYVTDYAAAISISAHCHAGAVFCTVSSL
jgi:hypothetical protein